MHLLNKYILKHKSSIKLYMTIMCTLQRRLLEKCLILYLHLFTVRVGIYLGLHYAFIKINVFKKSVELFKTIIL